MPPIREKITLVICITKYIKNENITKVTAVVKTTSIAAMPDRLLPLILRIVHHYTKDHLVKSTNHVATAKNGAIGISWFAQAAI